MPKLTVQAVRHVAFEDLGSFELPLQEAGYDIEYIEVAETDFGSIDPLRADLLILLGGPLGVYDQKTYPVIARELDLLRIRLAAERPTLGICLGAQMIAAALDARVYPAGVKELGWATIDLTAEGKLSSLSALHGRQVLHWHDDTFDLPENCERLAFTDHCPNQAFARGANVLGLQFHAEAIPARIEHWLIGHACELAASGNDPVVLRTAAADADGSLEEAARAMIKDWISGIE